MSLSWKWSYSRAKHLDPKSWEEQRKKLKRGEMKELKKRRE